MAIPIYLLVVKLSTCFIKTVALLIEVYPNRISTSQIRIRLGLSSWAGCQGKNMEANVSLQMQKKTTSQSNL